MSYRSITVPAKLYNLTVLSTIVGAVILLSILLVSVIGALWFVSYEVQLLLSNTTSYQLLTMQAVGICGFFLWKKYETWRLGVIARVKQN